MCSYPANQVVTAPAAIVTALGLAGHQASLAAWYGEPVAAADAVRLHADTEKALRARLCAGLPAFQLHVLQLLGHFWMNVSISLEYQQLAASATGQHERALLEIVYGQLLLSRRLRPALEHLDRGFSLAAGFLNAQDYFLLVRRHELLRHIPLSAMQAAPRGLQDMLAEAAVIKQLQGAERIICRNPHQDTIG